MSYDPVVEQAALAAARQLVPEYGAKVEAEVEAALYGPGAAQPPNRYFDPVAIGSLILAAAQFAYQIRNDHKKDGKPSRDALARAVRVEWRKEADLTAGAEKIIEIISAEIVQRTDNTDGV